jgi:hypothetical protein
LWANTALEDGHFDNMLQNESNLLQNVIKRKGKDIEYFTKCHIAADLTIKTKEKLLLLYQYAVTLHCQLTE